MGESSRKKRKSSLSAADYRDWSSLPDGPLISILDRLFSLPDHCSFAAVCRYWRSLSRSPSSNSSRPPLLLRPLLYHHAHNLRWTNPPRCRLDSPIFGSPSHLSPLSSPTLTKFCIGSSFGHLIFIRARSILIADVFTGNEIRPPHLRLDGNRIQTKGFLTAPPSSAECRLLLTGCGSTILSWQVGSQEWAEHQLARSVLTPVQQILPFRGRILALDFAGRLFTVTFSPQLNLDLWEDLPLLPLACGMSAEHLVECGSELLRIRFCYTMELFHEDMEVYRLDLTSVAASWVRVESLGDWCLFLDARGRCAMACSEPTRWGGRSNSVYVSGPGCDGWSELQLDGPLIDTNMPDSPFHSTKRGLPLWPSPLWVYPSMLH